MTSDRPEKNDFLTIDLGADAEEAGEELGETPGRRAFRIPIKDASTLSVVIDGKDYGALDIVEGGVGVLHTQDQDFAIGQELRDMQLLFKNQCVDVQGLVVHITEDPRGWYHHGVMFVGLEEEQEELLKSSVQEIRKEFFSKD